MLARLPLETRQSYPFDIFTERVASVVATECNGIKGLKKAKSQMGIHRGVLCVGH